MSCPHIKFKLVTLRLKEKLSNFLHQLFKSTSIKQEEMLLFVSLGLFSAYLLTAVYLSIYYEYIYKKNAGYTTWHWVASRRWLVKHDTDATESQRLNEWNGKTHVSKSELLWYRSPRLSPWGQAYMGYRLTDTDTPGWCLSGWGLKLF